MFFSEADLSSHVNARHGDGTLGAGSNGTGKSRRSRDGNVCDICGKSYATTASLSLHRAL